MTSITYVGLDVHTTNYTACCYSMQDDQAFAIVQMEPDASLCPASNPVAPLLAICGPVRGLAG